MSELTSGTIAEGMPGSRSAAQPVGMSARSVATAWSCVGLVLGLLTVAPVAWLFVAAFKPASETFTLGLNPATLTLANVAYVFTQVNFLRFLLNTFFVAATVTAVALFLHSMAGYALARLRFPGRELIFVGMFSTFFVSLPVIIVPLFIIVKTFGMLNSYAGLIVPSIFNVFGIFLLRQFYLSVPRELEEAALMDGAGFWRIYVSVILPLSRPILAALAILFFLANWNSFLWPLTITNDARLWLVQLAIVNLQGQYSGAWNYVIAASAIVTLPTTILFLVFQRSIIESVKTSGLK